MMVMGATKYFPTVFKAHTTRRNPYLVLEAKRKNSAAKKVTELVGNLLFCSVTVIAL